MTPDTLELRRLCEELVRQRQAYAESEDGSVAESDAFRAIDAASTELDAIIGSPEDIILALLDCLDAAEGREAWQPIETARVGVLGLVWGPKAGDRTDCFGTVVEYSDGGRFVTSQWHGVEHTHWRPLPEAPTPPKEESQ